VQILGVLAAVAAIFFFWGTRAYQRKQLQLKAQKAKERADAEREKVAVEAERQRHRRETVAEIEKDKQELDKRLEALKKRTGKLMILLLAIFLATATGVVRAETEAPQLPSDYAQLAKLYFAALDRIVELEAQLNEAISIAEGYKTAYEKLKIQYDSAEASVTRLMETIKTLQDVINQQHEIVLKLSGKKNLGLIGGLTVQPGNNPGEIKPGALIALQVEF